MIDWMTRGLVNRESANPQRLRVDSAVPADGPK
jgi:hypothetical protein